MSWEEDYKKKLVTPEEAVSIIKSGDRVCFVQGNEPQALGLALAALLPLLTTAVRDDVSLGAMVGGSANKVRKTSFLHPHQKMAAMMIVASNSEALENISKYLLTTLVETFLPSNSSATLNYDEQL